MLPVFFLVLCLSWGTGTAQTPPPRSEQSEPAKYDEEHEPVDDAEPEEDRLGDPGAYVDEEAEEGTSLDTPVKGDEDIVQELRDQPLDLNKVTEDQLRDLPGVDRSLARRIVRARAVRKRFRSVDELLSIQGMTTAIFDDIRPLVKVTTPGYRDAFFAGDTRFRMRNVNPKGSSFFNAPEEFQHNTYFYNRTRFRFGAQTQVGWLAKRASVGPALTPEKIQRQATLKESVQITDVKPFDKVVLGNYTLSQGQGLVFYDGLGEFVRPGKVKARGARPDFTSGSNEYHKGAALEGRVGPFDTSVFVSQKELDLSVHPTSGTVDQDINSLRQILGDLQDEESLENNDTVSERLYGGRVAYHFLENTTIGVSGFEANYSRVIDPSGTTYSGSHVFRGDRSQVGGIDFDAYYKSLNLFGEIARSHSSGPDGIKSKNGTAWTATPMFRLAPYYFWASFFNYDEDYFSRHAKGVSFGVVGAPEELTDNQRGVVLGFEYQGKKYKNRTNYTIASFPHSQGNGENSDPILPSQGRQIYIENIYAAPRGLELYFRYQRREQDTYGRIAGTNTRLQSISDLQKFRYQVSWRASSSVRYRVRYETRYEDAPEFTDRASGYLVMGDVRYKPVRSLTLNARMYYFDSPNANLNTGVEEIWNKVVYYRLAGAMNDLAGTPGTRFYLIAKQDIGPDLDVWFKYDRNHRPRDLRVPQSSVSNLERKVFGAARHGFHMQVDYKWGGPGRRSDVEEYPVLPTDWERDE